MKLREFAFASLLGSSILCFVISCLCTGGGAVGTNRTFLIYRRFIRPIFVVKKRVNFLTCLQWIYNNGGFPVLAWFGSRYVYLTSNPLEIKVILSHPQCYDKGKTYDRFKIFFKNSLLLVPYEIWKPRRQHYQRSFKPNIIKNFYSCFYEQSCKLLEEINEMKKGQDLFTFFNKYSFANFFYTFAGFEKNVIFKDMTRFGELLDMMQDEAASLLLDPLTPTSIGLKLYPAGWRINKMMTETRQIIERLVQIKRKEHRMQKDSIEINNDSVPLTNLMTTVTENEIIEEIAFFAGAATDTTGHSMAFIFTLLGMHPDIQETLYNEIASVLGQGPISYNDLPNLKYTEAVIAESLRLFPPVSIVSRTAGADIDLGTKILPEGIEMSINIFHLHRDPAYWENPLKFDPTRFLPENATKMNPHAYIPFLSGRRDCIGKAQALMLLKTTVANVTRHFRITSNLQSVEDINLMSCITIKSTHPLDCHFTPRLKE